MAIGIKFAMQSKGISLEAMAALLHLHRNSVANKVNGESAFYVDEAFALQKNMFPEYTLEYLFAQQAREPAERQVG